AKRIRLRPPTRTGWALALLILLSLLIFSHWFNDDRSEIDFGFFHDQLTTHNIQSLDVRGQTAYGEFKQAPVALIPATGMPVGGKNPDKKTASDKSGEAQPSAFPQLLKKKFVVGLLPPGVDAELRKELLAAGIDPLTSSEPTDYTNFFALIWLVL